MIKVGSGQVTGLGGVGSVQLDPQSADIELLLTMVQLNRAGLVEDQLRSQVQDVQARNTALQLCNTLKSALGIQKNHFADAQGNSQLIDQPYYKEQSTAWQVTQFNEAYGKDPAGALTAAQNGTYGGAFKELAGVALDARAAGLDDSTVGKLASGKISATELEASAAQVNGKIDNYSSSQQIEMIKLQSLSQRRAEAFEIVTNSIKKFSDNHASMVSNMR